MNLGEKINYYRESRGLTQAELGAELFVTRQTVSLWEKGQTLPSLDNIVRLAEIFDITIDELLKKDVPDKKDSNGEVAVVNNGVSKEISSNEEIKGNESNADKDNLPKDAAAEQDKKSAVEKNKFSRFLGKKRNIIVISCVLFAVILAALVLAFVLRDKTITDKKIESIIGVALPEYDKRAVIKNPGGTEESEIFAITEISFSENVYDKLKYTMEKELPSRVDSVLGLAFLYKDSELFLLYDLDEEQRAPEISGRGEYVFVSYDAESKILRITEFEK